MSRQFQPLPYPITRGSAVLSPDEKYAIIIPGSSISPTTLLYDSLPHTKGSVLLIDGKTISAQGKKKILISLL